MILSNAIVGIALPAQTDATAIDSSGLLSLIWVIFVVAFPVLAIVYAIWLLRYAKTRRRINEDYIARLLAHMPRSEEQLDRIAQVLDEVDASVKMIASKLETQGRPVLTDERRIGVGSPKAG